MEACNKESKKTISLDEDVSQGIGVEEQMPQLSKETGREDQDKTLPDESIAMITTEETSDPIARNC